MIKILFLIHDLSVGGAEKVLVNLVNNMDSSIFDVTVMTMFDEGVNRQFLKPHIRYLSWFKRSFPGNSHFMKLLSPRMLHNVFIKDHYDIEVAYLEGPSARVISGCSSTDTKLVAWIHSSQHDAQCASVSFRNETEARACYSRFDRIISVSKVVQEAFQNALELPVEHQVLYNTNESADIIAKAKEPVENGIFKKCEIKLVAVGRLIEIKGFDRLLRIINRLQKDGHRIHMYLLGVGPEKASLERYTQEHKMEEIVTLLGYQTNPYKYVAKCDLFVCSSYSEGFSTAATEALIVGTPVCTVDVAGMQELLGDNEFGVIVPNNEQALFQAIRKMIEDPELMSHYKRQAEIRGKDFETHKTVKAVETMLLDLLG